VKRLGEQTLYEILEVPSDAAPDDVRAALERARAIFGPGSLAMYTLMSPDEASLMNRRIEEAGATLLDPEARARYDARLGVGSSGESAPIPGASVTAHAPAPTSTSTAWGSMPPVIPARHVEPFPAPAPRREPPASGGGERREARPPGATPVPTPSEGPAPGRAPLLLVTPFDAAGEAARGPAPAPAQAAPQARAPIRLERPVTIPQAALTPPPARPEPAAAPEAPPAGEDTPWTGEMLRRTRESRGIPIQIIAERTKVTRHHLENIEADRFSLLPAPVYLRGILLGIARELRLDGQKVARSYLERMSAALAPPAPPGPKR